MEIRSWRKRKKPWNTNISITQIKRKPVPRRMRKVAVFANSGPVKIMPRARKISAGGIKPAQICSYGRPFSFWNSTKIRVVLRWDSSASPRLHASTFFLFSLSFFLLSALGFFCQLFMNCQQQWCFFLLWTHTDVVVLDLESWKAQPFGFSPSFAEHRRQKARSRPFPKNENTIIALWQINKSRSRSYVMSSEFCARGANWKLDVWVDA